MSFSIPACPHRALGPGINHLIPLSFSFLTCEMDKVTLILESCDKGVSSDIGMTRN